MKKIRVLIHNDNSKRDLLGLKILQFELEKLGFKTKICNSQEAEIMFRLFKPNIFLASRADQYISKQASKNCLVFIIPGEGGHQTKETMLSVFMGRGYWKLDNVDWIKRCYLWNRNTYDWLIETKLFKENQLKVVGNSRLDIYKNKKLLDSQNNKQKKFKIGVAFSAKSTSTYYGPPHFPKVYYDMNPKMNYPITIKDGHFEDIVWRDHSILRNMMTVIKSCIEKDIGDIVLRPSPFEDPKEFDFLKKLHQNKIQILPRQTLPEFLSEIDVLLTCWSTVGLEAIILDKPVISIAGLISEKRLFQHISKKASGFDTFVNFYSLPKSIIELENEIYDIKNHNNKNKDLKFKKDKLLQDLYSWDSKKLTSKEIADDIFNTVAEEDFSKQKDWKYFFPIKFNLPVWLALLIKRTIIYIRAFRSGTFISYLGFYSNSDKEIIKLFKKYKKTI
tara:strand:+ start:8396 stop:9736 length:1341 start_codon:yes stop_codon:yes gene_type:complete